MKRKPGLLFVLIHIFLAVSTAWITWIGMKSAENSAAPAAFRGIRYLYMFTSDSNIFAGFASLVILLLLLRGKPLPDWAELLQYASACAVTLTFLTTALFLAPIQVLAGNSYFMIFGGEYFFFHFFNPVLAAIACCIGRPRKRWKKRVILLGMLPAVVYGVVYTANVLYFRTWPDFYGFTLGGKPFMVPVALAVMLIATSLIAAVLRRGHNRACKRASN